MTEPEVPSVEGLEQAVKDAILHRTGGRVRALEVSTAGSAIVVRGRAPSYYVVQLALRGVFDIIGPPGTTVVELHIEVPKVGP
jgi:hypothetical protein